MNNITWNWPNFTPQEMASGDGEAFPILSPNAREFMDCLQYMRRELGFPFVISSGFRSKAHNKKIGGAPQSLHLYGMAADIQCNGEQAFTIVSCAASYGFRGIGVSQKGNIGTRFIHVDTRKSVVRSIWSY